MISIVYTTPTKTMASPSKILVSGQLVTHSLDQVLLVSFQEDGILPFLLRSLNILWLSVWLVCGVPPFELFAVY
jgi:hypothetical protein